MRFYSALQHQHEIVTNAIRTINEHCLANMYISVHLFINMHSCDTAAGAFRACITREIAFYSKFVRWQLEADSPT